MKSAIRVAGVLMVLVVGSPWAYAQSEANEVKGTGTAGQIPVWVGPHRIQDSLITQNSDGSLSLTTSTTGAAVFVSNSATSGNTNGLFGQAASPTGNGVLGVNNATSGFAVGVTGFSASPEGAGLNGFSLSTSGGIGVIGSSPTSGVAIQGVN